MKALWLLLGCLGSAGCGRQAPADTIIPTASICGRVYFRGRPPTPEAFELTAYPDLTDRFQGQVFREEVIVNPNGTLKNAFVSIQGSIEGMQYAVPAEPVVLDQTGCRYEPRVLGIQARQKLKFICRDGVIHAPYCLPRNSRAGGGPPRPVDKPLEVSFSWKETVKIKSEVYPWMVAYCHVLDHPFFSATDDRGEFLITGLPPGDYTLAAWHERCGEQKRVVSLSPGEQQELDFEFTE